MPSFEESLKKLETIVDQLEKGDLALEDSLKLFEEGVGLSAACKQELDAAEGKGMEVSSAKLELANAHEALIIARVNVHTFRDSEVQKVADPGLAIAKGANQAGVAALAELNFRRKGLGISLITILVAIAGLYLKIRQIESRQQN